MTCHPFLIGEVVNQFHLTVVGMEATVTTSSQLTTYKQELHDDQEIRLEPILQKGDDACLFSILRHLNTRVSSLHELMLQTRL